MVSADAGWRKPRLTADAGNELARGWTGRGGESVDVGRDISLAVPGWLHRTARLSTNVESRFGIHDRDTLPRTPAFYRAPCVEPQRGACIRVDGGRLDEVALDLREHRAVANGHLDRVARAA